MLKVRISQLPKSANELFLHMSELTACHYTNFNVKHEQPWKWKLCTLEHCWLLEASEFGMFKALITQLPNVVHERYWHISQLIETCYTYFNIKHEQHWQWKLCPCEESWLQKALELEMLKVLISQLSKSANELFLHISELSACHYANFNVKHEPLWKWKLCTLEHCWLLEASEFEMFKALITQLPNVVHERYWHISQLIGTCYT